MNGGLLANVYRWKAKGVGGLGGGPGGQQYVRCNAQWQDLVPN